MREIVLGICGVGAVGTAAVYGVGGDGPNDYVATVAKPPSAVYAAFSSLGNAGETVIPGRDGHRLVQRVVKVPNEQVKLELLLDDKPLLSAEVQLGAEGTGTRVAAELDIDGEALTALMAEDGAPPMPSFALQEFLLDQVFARAMGEMVERIEEGKPLLSLAATRARWGRDGEPGSPSRSGSTHSQRAAVAPSLDTRPAIDPNAAARAHMAGTGPGSRD